MDVIPYPDGHSGAMPRETSSRSSEINPYQQMFPNPCSQIMLHLRAPCYEASPMIVQHEHTIPRSAAPTQVAPVSTACRAQYQPLITNHQNLSPVSQSHSRRLPGRSILPLIDFYQCSEQGRQSPTHPSPVS
jgi:hypothetical protein